MKKILFSCFLMILGLQMVSHVFALYTESVVVSGNVFMPGTYRLQLSTTDTDGNGIADPAVANWVNIPTSVWQTPVGWAPGQTFSRTVFVRSAGNIDIGNLKVWFKRNQGTGEPVEEHIALTKAWYDRNGNGVQDSGEDLLPTILSLVDTNSNNTATLQELLTKGHTGLRLELETGGTVLPGSATNAQLGGTNGTGKGVTFEWKLLSTVPVTYGGSHVTVDFEFLSEYVPN